MKKTLIVIAFGCGLICGLWANKMVKPVKAEVAGMDSYDLKSDYDFKRAVRYIVEDCKVDGTKIRC